MAGAHIFFGKRHFRRKYVREAQQEKRSFALIRVSLTEKLQFATICFAGFMENDERMGREVVLGGQAKTEEVRNEKCGKG